MSTSTISELESMTDAGLFERIASAVLRYAEPKIYKNISHQGVNPSGKTIKAPLDNVGWAYTDDGDMLVAVAHTTTRHEDLEKKWLHELVNVKPRKGPKPTGTDGDLVKAIKNIQEIRKAFPKLKARLALMCNCEDRLGVRVKAETLASAHNIELDIWSVSRLGEFLDTDSNGQTIRHNYLGVLPTRLSQPELFRIGAESIKSIVFEESNYVSRKELSNTKHTFIVGVSGVGKTTFCINTLRKYLANNQPILRMSDHTVKNSLSIEEAIDIELRRYSPDLLPYAGLEALRICSVHNPLIVLVEDINRSTDSLQLIKKLMQWTQAENKNWRLLCPVWHRLIASLDSDDKKFLEKHLHTFYLDVYTEREATESIHKLSISDGIELDSLSAHQLAKQLGYDPLLISLYDSSAVGAYGQDVIGLYINQSITRVASVNACYKDELDDALDEYALALFKNKKLQVNTRELRSIVSDKTKSTLQYFFADATLLRLVSEGQNDVVMARHDRINFYLIARALSNYINSDESLDLSDPYFAEIIGLACVLGGINLRTLYEISLKNTLVAFYAYAYALKVKESYLEQALNNVKQWFAVAHHLTPDLFKQRFASLNILNEIIHASIIDILDLYPTSDHHLNFYEISFKNGNLGACANWLMLFDFEHEFAGRKQAIDSVFHRYTSVLRNRICELLGSDQTSVRFKHALLILIGYTENQDFSNAVRQAWKLIPTEKRDVRIFFWAAARVCDSDPDTLLSPIFDFWQSLSEETNQIGSSEKYSFARYSLDWKFRDHAPNHSIEYILKQAQERHDLYDPILYMLRDVDHPDVLEAQAERSAEISRKSGFHSGDILDGLRRNSENNKGLSTLSKQRLLSISENPINDEFLRKKAFDLWEVSPSTDDLNILQAIQENDVRYHRTIWGRAKRQDLTVIDSLIDKINEDPRYWWQSGRYIWNDKLTDLLESHISSIDEVTSLDDIWLLPSLLEKVSQRKAELILISNWDRISEIPNFIHTAIFLATPKLNELVENKIANLEDPKEIFKFFGSHIGLREVGRDGITRFEQIEAIQPYLHFLDEMCLSDLSEICLKNNWKNYLNDFIKPLLTGNKYVRYIEIDTFHLDQDLEKNKISFSYRWLEDRLKDGWTHQESVEKLFQWFQKNQSEMSLEILGEILSRDGTREDFIRLETLDIGFPKKSGLLSRTHFSVFTRTLN